MYVNIDVAFPSCSLRYILLHLLFEFVIHFCILFRSHYVDLLVDYSTFDLAPTGQLEIVLGEELIAKVAPIPKVVDQWVLGAIFVHSKFLELFHPTETLVVSANCLFSILGLPYEHFFDDIYLVGDSKLLADHPVLLDLLIVVLDEVEIPLLELLRVECHVLLDPLRL